MLKKFLLIFAAGFVLNYAGLCDAKVYKWVDKNGLLHISDSPPPVALSDDRGDPAGYDEIRKRTENSTDIKDTISRVIVFGRKGCGLTQRMIRGLGTNNVPYLFQNVDSTNGKNHLIQRMQETGNKRNSYLLPVIYMHGELIYSPEVVTVVRKYKYE